jgi:hypothetical protein
MKYKQYEKAAKRHRATCDNLLKIVEDGFIGNKPIEQHEKDKMLENIYYLSGYVVECILSFKYFQLIKYNKNNSVYDFNDFKTYFSTHSKAPVIELIRERGGVKVNQIPIVGNIKLKQIEKDMYEHWKTKVRYTTIDLPFDVNLPNVFVFYSLCNKIYLTARDL